MDDTPVANRAPSTADEPLHAAEARPVRLAVIAAVPNNGVIGANNAMPWSLPEDLRHFRALTMGHRVVMGRKTWQSLGRPLPGRENVIVTRDLAFMAPPGCVVARSLDEALDGAAMPRPIFCIGGAQLYAQALPLADRLYLTRIDASFDGDTYMPPIDFDEWTLLSSDARVDPKSAIHYAFLEYARIHPR